MSSVNIREVVVTVPSLGAFDLVQVQPALIDLDDGSRDESSMLGTIVSWLLGEAVDTEFIGMAAPRLVRRPTTAALVCFPELFLPMATLLAFLEAGGSFPPGIGLLTGLSAGGTKPFFGLEALLALRDRLRDAGLILQ